MKRHWKKIVGAFVLLVALVVGGSWFYTKVWNKPPDKLSAEDLNAALDATVPATDPTPADSADTTTAAAGAAADPPSSTTAPQGAEGLWQAMPTSLVRYRVTESVNGFDTTAVGGTNAISGTMTIAGSTVTSAEFAVDMTTFSSDERRRDSQFNGRIMNVKQFPTSTFALTQPIEFGAIPADGESFATKATGDLTLHGTTNTVTFDLTATLKEGKIGIVGSIPIVFADYGVPNPSFATVKTADNGLLEFVLVFERP